LELVINRRGRCGICYRETKNNPSDVQYDDGSMGKKVICDACMTYLEPTPAQESLEMLRV